MRKSFKCSCGVSVVIEYAGGWRGDLTGDGFVKGIPVVYARELARRGWRLNYRRPGLSVCPDCNLDLFKEVKGG